MKLFLSLWPTSPNQEKPFCSSQLRSFKNLQPQVIIVSCGCPSRMITKEEHRIHVRSRPGKALPQQFSSAPTRGTDLFACGFKFAGLERSDQSSVNFNSKLSLLNRTPLHPQSQTKNPTKATFLSSRPVICASPVSDGHRIPAFP